MLTLSAMYSFDLIDYHFIEYQLSRLSKDVVGEKWEL